MSGDDWREARKHRQRKRDEMVECPRCAAAFYNIGQTPPRYFVGETCRNCAEKIQ